MADDESEHQHEQEQQQEQQQKQQEPHAKLTAENLRAHDAKDATAATASEKILFGSVTLEDMDMCERYLGRVIFSVGHGGRVATSCVVWYSGGIGYVAKHGG